MEERLKALEGITYSEWRKIKHVIDGEFEDIKEENTLKVNENVFKRFKVISNFQSCLNSESNLTVNSDNKEQ